MLALESSRGSIVIRGLAGFAMSYTFRRAFAPFVLMAAAAATPALAAGGSYEFLAAPQTDLNRVYRVDRATGEVGACQYGLKDKGVGVTLCYSAGEGAGPQTSSEYSLIASRHEREAGVFRVDLRTGAMSICYVLDESVVCTPLAR